MPVPDVPPPTEVLTLVFLAWAAGTAIVGAATRLQSEIGGGHFKVVWLVVVGLAAASGFGDSPAFVVAGLALLTFFSIYRSLDLPMALVTAAATVAVLATGAPWYAFALAALMGAVTNAMLLGHWHLNQPKLGTKPIVRLVWGLWAAIAAFIAAMGVLLTTDRLAGIGWIGAWTAIAFTAFCAVLTAMVTHLVRTRSIMSATGILYLEVLLVFVAAFTGSLAVLAGPA